RIAHLLDGEARAQREVGAGNALSRSIGKPRRFDAYLETVERRDHNRSLAPDVEELFVDHSMLHEAGVELEWRGFDREPVRNEIGARDGAADETEELVVVGDAIGGVDFRADREACTAVVTIAIPEDLDPSDRERTVVVLGEDRAASDVNDDRDRGALVIV